jgi:hypothetical protein
MNIANKKGARNGRSLPFMLAEDEAAAEPAVAAALVLLAGDACGDILRTEIVKERAKVFCQVYKRGAKG